MSQRITVLLGSVALCSVACWITGCSPPTKTGTPSTSVAPSATATGTSAQTDSTTPPAQNSATAPASTTTTTSDQIAADDPYAAGKKVFQANCTRCHKLAGVPALAGGSGGGPGGPGGYGGGPGGAGGGPPGGFGGGRGGGGGFGGGRAPDLSKVGADPKHTTDWLVAYIRNPKSQNPQARMPAFESKLSEDDLKALAEFLGSLKG